LVLKKDLTLVHLSLALGIFLLHCFALWVFIVMVVLNAIGLHSVDFLLICSASFVVSFHPLFKPHIVEDIL
jgi:hypothetical protein